MRIFSFLFLLMLPFVTDAQIWSEDFDGGNTTNPAMFSTPPCGDNNDYYGVVCSEISDTCSIEVDQDFVYNNVDGKFFGARDMDSTPCGGAVTLNETFTYSGIDISSSPAPTVLYICFDVAESRNMDINGDGDFSDGAEWGSTNMREDTWDGNSYFHVDASVDGAPFTRVTQIENFTENGSSSDKRPGIDVNCNGQSNDVGEPELTDTFTKYCFELPTSGASLALEFEINGLNGGGEDLAVDNIEVYSGTTPAAGTLLDACTPFQASNPACNGTTTIFLENFDGSNTAFPPTVPNCDATPSRDYLGIVCNNGDGCPNEINSDYLYFGASGQYFGVRDMDNVCGGSIDETLSFAGIDISACPATSDLYLCLDMAESQPNNGREMTGNPPVEDSWDGNSNVNFMVSIDGCPFEEVTALESTNGTNSRPAIDLNCGGGSATTDFPLSDTFQTFCFLLTKTGNTLDLNIQVIGLIQWKKTLLLKPIVLLELL